MSLLAVLCCVLVVKIIFCVGYIFSLQRELKTQKELVNVHYRGWIRSDQERDKLIVQLKEAEKTIDEFEAPYIQHDSGLRTPIIQSANAGIQTAKEDDSK